MDPKSREKHQYPGELEYKTIIYKPIVSIEYLKKIEEEDLPFGKDAVFVISYPKSGQCERNNHDVTWIFITLSCMGIMVLYPAYMYISVG